MGLPNGYEIKRDGNGYRWFRCNSNNDVINVGKLCDDQVLAIIGAWRHFFVEVGTNASADTVMDVMKRWVQTQPREVVRQCATCEQADKLTHQAEVYLLEALEEQAVNGIQAR